MRAADLSAIAEALPEEAVLVEYVRFETFDLDAVRQRGEHTWRPARYAAFVLRVDNPAGVELIDLGEGEQVEELIRRFRTAITREQERRHGGPPEQEVSIGEQPKPSAREAGEALRAALFDPLQPVLGGRTRLIVAPDGELARIPFEVLPVGQSRLIDTYLISYVATGRDVLRFGASTGLSRNRALVCADPDFDLGVSTATATRVEPQFQQSRDLQQNLSGFERLEGTRTEGQQVAELLAVEPLLGQAVLETTVKQCRGPYVLHLATHGFFLPEQKAEPLEHQSVLQGDAAWWSRLAHLENPLLRSGLALAGANTARRGGALPNEAEDGLLTAADVTALDLIGTQLVVLSACETGLGEIRVGEGVFGLRRAFSVAGAQTVVMSLWKVPDEQTRALMQDFYLRLQAGEGRATALREAQLTMKRRTDHPLFWGGFICEGEPGPLRDDADEKQAELRAPTRITTDGV